MRGPRDWGAFGLLLLALLGAWGAVARGAQFARPGIGLLFGEFDELPDALEDRAEAELLERLEAELPEPRRLAALFAAIVGAQARADAECYLRALEHSGAEHALAFSPNTLRDYDKTQSRKACEETDLMNDHAGDHALAARSPTTGPGSDPRAQSS